MLIEKVVEAIEQAISDDRIGKEEAGSLEWAVERAMVGDYSVIEDLAEAIDDLSDLRDSASIWKGAARAELRVETSCLTCAQLIRTDFERMNHAF